MQTFVALMRGINVAGARSLPMAGLRALCEELGYERPQTYIQSGNLLLDAEGDAEGVATALEAGINRSFGFACDVIVREAASWCGYLDANPFARDSEAQAKMVHLCLARKPLKAGAADAICAKAAGGERVVQAGDAIWIDYAGGVGRSKLTPALLDRAAGSGVTARNLNTVSRLAAMIEARA